MSAELAASCSVGEKKRVSAMAPGLVSMLLATVSGRSTNRSRPVKATMPPGVIGSPLETVSFTSTPTSRIASTEIMNG